MRNAQNLDKRTEFLSSNTQDFIEVGAGLDQTDGGLFIPEL